MPRRHLLTAALATTLLLGACGSDGDADDGDDAQSPVTENRTVEAADPALPAAPDRFVATMADAHGLDLTPVEQGGTGVRTDSLEVDVTAVGLFSTIPAELYTDVASSLHTDFAPEEVDAEEVRAADGRAFVVATYETRQVDGSTPGAIGTVKLEGHDAALLFDTTEEDAPSTATIVVSVPAEHTVQDAVLEVTGEGSAQAVSLVDGTLAWGGSGR